MHHTSMKPGDKEKIALWRDGHNQTLIEIPGKQLTHKAIARKILAVGLTFCGKAGESYHPGICIG